MRKRLFYFLPIVLLGLFGAIAWVGLAPNRDPSALPSALIGMARMLSIFKGEIW